ncbi:peptidylprolyl isomerase [Candidatus Thiosymbion oneisti]|uniref:peptidylprolyl isomerase n=1 Tax=Candidatus Thiosymbion oneisti TaxID=589554 RepID=UPI000B7F922A|nr:peptidylprolyl isomerase [Candidatus Thiosymbion oneisti]
MRRAILVLAGVSLLQTVLAAEAPGEVAGGSILSSGGGRALTRTDYADFFAGRELSPEFRQGLLTSDETLREFVLDFHSNKALARRAESMGLDATPEFRRALNSVRERLLVRALMDRQGVAEDAEAPDFLALARERYAVDPSAFAIPERRKAAHILIRDIVPRGEGCRCEPPIAIADLQARLDQGTSFTELAKQFSEDKGSAAQGGLIDRWVARDSDEFVPPFHEALFALPRQGDVSPPVQTQYGTHLIQWANTEPGRIPEFQELREALMARLRAEYVKSKRSRLRSEAYPNLDSLRLDEMRALLEQVEPSP